MIAIVAVVAAFPCIDSVACAIATRCCVGSNGTCTDTTIIHTPEVKNSDQIQDIPTTAASKLAEENHPPDHTVKTLIVETFTKRTTRSKTSFSTLHTAVRTSDMSVGP